ncbi:hypothetical protein [Actinomadura coerulea]|uniref:hypothetical protein n=1 Tax=Actinomadura coerulea TaxID=46159 RepID=UPI001E53BDAD|nr:hypothetical protein [Actinomadura coerulea]
MRHTCVPLLLDLGVPPHIVREIVGHSDIEVTMTIYAHAALDETRPTASSGVPSADSSAHDGPGPESGAVYAFEGWAGADLGSADAVPADVPCAGGSASRAGDRATPRRL